MAMRCNNCGRRLKSDYITHCSDECLLAGIRHSRSLSRSGIGSVAWDERADPWT